MNFIKISLVALTGSILLSSCAGLYLKSGKTAFEDLKYQEAIKYLEKGLSKKDDTEARVMLADSYLKVNDFSNASEAYSKAALSPNFTDKDRLHQGMSLMSVGQYGDARTIFEGVVSRDPNNTEAQALLQSCKKLNEMREDSLLYTVAPLNIPTSDPVYSAVKHNNGLIVTSASSNGDADPYTNKAFTDLFYTKLENGNWSSLAPISDVNSKSHDAVAAVSPNGQLMIFTRSFQLKNALSGNDNNESPTQLYQSRYADGKWSKPEIIPFCDVKYMYAHPTFSADGSTMYFASDMPGGKGGMDLYQSKFAEGSWGLPVNLGGDINTKGDELFPSIKDANTMYFSSDAHNSLGGLDILKTSFINGAWSIPQHLSYPLNTGADDFSITFNEDGKTGYLSSDRSGVDKVYSFEILDPKINIDGLITNKDTMLPIAGAKITLKNLTDGTEKTYFADENGKFDIDLEPGKDYKMLYDKDGYFSDSEDISTKGVTTTKTFKKIIEMPTVVVTDPLANNGEGNNSEGNNGIGKPNKDGVYPVPNIYWDYQEWYIRDDARPYLDDLVELFRNNQNLRFEIQSHCDCRGSFEFNDDLSAKRARAVTDYLVSRGVPRSIMISKGMGERMLLNECSDNVPCTEEQHQLNRRTEFIVTEKK